MSLDNKQLLGESALAFGLLSQSKKGTRTPADEMKSVLNESLAKDIRNLLSKVRELGANLNYI